MSNLVLYRAGICTTLAADERLTGVQIYSHPGGFDLAEIKAYAKKTPAILVSIQKVDAENKGGEAWGSVAVSLVVFTMDRANSPRDVRALQIVEALMNILRRSPNQYWGLSDTFGLKSPTDAHAENLYSRKLDDEGVALWGVVFHQDIEMTFVPVGDDFESLAVKWDLAPRSNDAPIGTPADPQPTGAVIDAQDLLDLT